MVSPARRHFLKHTAEKQAKQASEFGGMQNATMYELQLAQLNGDRARLKQIESTEGKEALKAMLLPNYLPYVEGVIASDAGVQDDVVTTVMVWLIDVAEYVKALDVAAYVLRHGLVMPDQFERKPTAIITENIANAALKAVRNEQDFDVAVLHHLADLVTGLDMHNQVEAKLHLALAKVLLRQIPDGAADTVVYAQLQVAEKHLLRAIALNENCGGKNDLLKVRKGLEQVIKKQDVTDLPKG